MDDSVARSDALVTSFLFLLRAIALHERCAFGFWRFPSPLCHAVAPILFAMAIADVPEAMLAAQVVKVTRSRAFIYECANIIPPKFNTPYKIHEIPTPKSLGPYDVLLKIAVASLCHTDGMVRAGIMGTKLPCVASHEGCGTAVAFGPAVTDFKPGDRVMAGLPRNRCGHCPDCLGDENYRHYCPNIAGHVGVTLDGAFAEYMIVDGRESSKIPDEVSFETAAPLACAGCTIWRGVLQTELKKGEVCMFWS